MARANIFYVSLIFHEVIVYERIGVFAYLMVSWLHNSLVRKEYAPWN